MASELTTIDGYFDTRRRYARKPQPPCATCDKRTTCADQLVACQDYVTFVQTGRKRSKNRDPDREHYELAFGDNDEYDSIDRDGQNNESDA